MCDLDQIYGILLGANILLIAAIAACVLTIALNAGIFTFMGAPVAFGIALAAAIAANIAFLPVINLLTNCTTGPCAAIAREIIELLSVVAGSLAAGISAAYVAVIFTGVPVAAAGPVGIVSVCLVMASMYLMRAVTRLTALVSCLSAPPPPTSTAVTVTAGTALAFTVVGVVVFGLFSIGWERSRRKKDNSQ